MGAAAGGFLGGAVGGQGGYLFPRATGRILRAAQYVTGGGGSWAGGYLEHAITGEDYDGMEKGYDIAGGLLLSRFPGASDLGSNLGSNPSWMTHSFAAYGGAHAGAIVESAKFVGGEVIERWTGVEPW
ncbi:hypothetical protein GCM10017711_04600 [Paeniglutamicibacter sulfureus]